uniref:NB-ARC domain-containing protein n=1 Tax=Fagus sylvatica TaxID=28930 RepID=A0A2N9GL59_FAGSY
MAESVVSGVVSRLGDLLIQEANFLSGMQGRMNQRLVRQWVSEIREVAYDADDIIGTYALNSCIQEGRRHKEGPQEFLLKEEEGNRVASICGMGGLGKTTLAKMVYNHDKVKQHFDCRAWIPEVSSQLHADPRGFLHNLQFLNDACKKSWELLEKIAISWREDSIIKTNMESLGNEMLKYCGGLPLAITVLGGLLAAKHTQEEWDDVHRHVKSYLNVQEGLQFQQGQGHFPEDFEISTKELVRMWMAEGFIQKIQHESGREETMEDVGERYLRELMQRCMVLPKRKIFSKSPIFVEQAHIGKIRRLAINVESDDDYLNVKGIKFNEHPYLRSLLYFGPSDLPFKESRFKKFKLLRVLNLENFENYHIKLPKDIGCLIHLRFLSLKGSNVNNVPSSMGNLRCLQTLDLRYRFGDDDVRVPNVFKKMEQLRHLYLPRNYKGTQLEEDPMATLEKLPNLKILRLLCRAFEGKNMVCSERGFPQLQSLVLSELFNLEEWRVEEGAMPSLCRLRINECDSLRRIPDGLRFVTTLQELEIKSMPKTFKDRVDKGGEDFCKVQHVPSLVFQHCDAEW